MDGTKWVPGHVLSLLQRATVVLTVAVQVISVLAAMAFDLPWIWVLLYFSMPAGVLILFALSLIRYLLCKRHASPTTHEVKAWLVVTTVLVGVLVAVVIGLIALFALAVRYM